MEGEGDSLCEPDPVAVAQGEALPLEEALTVLQLEADIDAVPVAQPLLDPLEEYELVPVVEGEEEVLRDPESVAEPQGEALLLREAEAVALEKGVVDTVAVLHALAQPLPE